MASSSLFVLVSFVLFSGHAFGQDGSWEGVSDGAEMLGLAGGSLGASALRDVMLPRLAEGGLRGKGQPLSLYLPVFAEDNSTCRVALDGMISSLEGNASSAVWKMVDSWGKFRDGYLYGFPGFVSFGVFSECVNAEEPQLGIKGKYCTIFLLDNMTQSASQAEPRMPQASASFQIGTGVSYSTCMPNACSEEDLMKSLAVALSPEKVAGVICQSPDDPPHFEAGDIAMICFLSLMLALLLAGTLADVFYQRVLCTAPTSGWRFLIPFSVYTNLDKIFQITTESRPGVISCLHGMRVLSMTWVIYGHQYIMNFGISANLSDIQKWTSSLLFQIISNATPSTDSFFFLSGLLVTYGVLREIKRTGRLNIVMYYAHRIIRLTPPIALVSLFMATLFRFFISGPIKYFADTTVNFCRDTWWMDVTYTNNFLGYDKETNQLKDCLGQCWYTAVDTQLYLVAPIVLLPLAFHPKKGKIFLFLVTVVSVIIPAAVVYANNFPPGSILDAAPDYDTIAFQRLVYFAPWCRMSAYIVGIWTGYVIFKQGSKKLTMTPLQVMTGWTVAVFSALAVLLGMFSYNQISNDVVPYDPVTQILYGGLHRAVWCASLAWVVVACHFGYGGVVNDFLSHPSWQPLSRLTYAMYLVAIPVQICLYCVMNDFVYLSHVNKILETCGSIFISIIAALLVSLTVEAPILGLEKLLLKRPGRGEESSPPPPLATEGRLGQENLAFEEDKETKKEVEMKEEGSEEKNEDLAMKNGVTPLPTGSEKTEVTVL